MCLKRQDTYVDSYLINMVRACVVISWVMYFSRWFSFLSAISSRFYRFVFSFLRCYPQIAKCVVYQPLVSLRICPTATRCHVVTVTLSRCHIVTLSRCHAVTCIVMKLTWTMLSRINGQSWLHCQYCSHIDRAYGLKIFSVLFTISPEWFRSHSSHRSLTTAYGGRDYSKRTARTARPTRTTRTF